MIEIVRRVPNPDKLAAWLEATIRPHLTQDVSNYAKGRLRAWLGAEPMLYAPFDTKPGVPVGDKALARLAELIGWEFDFALVTYSGDVDPIGITPHRDAGFTGAEAFGLQVSSEARFDYWIGKPGMTTARKDTVVLTPGKDPPTVSLVLTPGDVVRFNCKNLHACAPATKRWNVNFWRKKPGNEAKTSSARS